MRRGSRGIDFSNTRVRMRRTQQLAISHARQKNIVRIPRLPRHFRACVDSSPRNTDDAHLAAIAHLEAFSNPGCAVGGLAPASIDAFPLAIRTIASSTASKICR